MPRSRRVILMGGGLVVAMVVAALAVGVAGCTGRITPPERVADPAVVFVADHGRHAGLVLTEPDGGMVEFAYGEWRWFARGQNLLIRGVPVLLWPTPATLARRRLEGPATPESVRAQITLTDLLAFEVEREVSEALRRSLEERFAAPGTEPVINEDLPDLRFVRTEPSYSIAHHCNTELVRWLRRLDCRVSVTPLLADFELAGDSGAAVFGAPSADDGERP